MEPTFTLNDNESIIWQGCPQRCVGVGQWGSLYLGALLFGGLVLWSLFGSAPDSEPLRGVHSFFSDTFCRVIGSLLALGAAIFPTLMARQTNGSTYCITSQRVLIRHANGTSVEASYEEMVAPKVKLLGEGLASFYFAIVDRAATENSCTRYLVYAIPAEAATEAKGRALAVHR